MGFFFPRSDIATKPAARTGVMAYSPNQGAFVMFGGQGLSDQLADTWVFNGILWEQKSPVTVPNKRRGHAMTTGLGIAGVLTPAPTMIGGYYHDGADNWLIDVYQWDGTNWVAITANGTPVTAREFHTITYDQDIGRFLITGGFDSNGAVNDAAFLRMGETPGQLDWYKPTFTGSFTARYGHAVVYDEVNNEFVMFGGESGPGAYLNNTYTLNGLTWHTENPSTVPAARSFHRMVWEPVLQKVILWGGKDSGGKRSDSYYWDKPPLAENGEWVPITITGTIPAGRSDFAMALDTDSEMIFLFGGDGSLLDDTWGFIPGAIDTNSLNIPLPSYPADVATAFKAEAGYWVPQQ